MSSFANKEKWKRHKAIFVDGKLYCERCHIDLPISLLAGSIVCSRYDRLFLGDLPEAVDCAV